jgi:hypothetical protein
MTAPAAWLRGATTRTSLMSALGQKQTLIRFLPMSAFGGKADIEISGRDVCF